MRRAECPYCYDGAILRDVGIYYCSNCKEEVVIISKDEWITLPETRIGQPKDALPMGANTDKDYLRFTGKHKERLH